MNSRDETSSRATKPSPGSLRFLLAEDPAQAAAAAATWLGERLRESAAGPVTLLLSGGSANKVHQHLAANAASLLPADLGSLECGLVDERWGEPGHAHSNAAAVRATGLVEEIERRGGRFHEVLGRAADLRETARSYEAWLAGRLRASRVFATIGLGADGHTFGVLPQADAGIFRELFPSDRLFVAYRHSEATAHSNRLTLAPAAALGIAVTGLVLGEEKAWVVRALLADSAAPLHAFPAALLRTLRGRLWTDVGLAGGGLEPHTPAARGSRSESSK